MINVPYCMQSLALRLSNVTTSMQQNIANLGCNIGCCKRPIMIIMKCIDPGRVKLNAQFKMTWKEAKSSCFRINSSLFLSISTAIFQVDLG